MRWDGEDALEASYTGLVLVFPKCFKELDLGTLLEFMGYGG